MSNDTQTHKLHIYPQKDANDSVQIVGTTEGLRDLRDAIDKAIDFDNKKGETKVSPADNQTYSIRVIQTNMEGVLDILPLPYTHPFNTELWRHEWDSAKKIPEELWTTLTEENKNSATNAQKESV